MHVAYHWAIEICSHYSWLCHAAVYHSQIPNEDESPLAQFTDHYSSGDFELSEGQLFDRASLYTLKHVEGDLNLPLL